MGFNLTINDYPRYTYKDYEKWEGDWELIRGIPYAMSPSPRREHQRFGSKFITACSNALHKTGITCNCEVLYECDWIVSDDTIVRPDVMISCDAKNSDWVRDTPSLVLKILSPATALKDRNTKFNLYQAYGVRYYLIADLGKKIVEIFSLKDNIYQETSDLKTFQLTKSCTIEISVSDLFD